MNGFILRHFKLCWWVIYSVKANEENDGQDNINKSKFILIEHHLDRRHVVVLIIIRRRRNWETNHPYSQLRTELRRTRLQATTCSRSRHARAPFAAEHSQRSKVFNFILFRKCPFNGYKQKNVCLLVWWTLKGVFQNPTGDKIWLNISSLLENNLIKLHADTSHAWFTCSLIMRVLMYDNGLYFEYEQWIIKLMLNHRMANLYTGCNILNFGDGASCE